MIYISQPVDPTPHKIPIANRIKVNSVDWICLPALREHTKLRTRISMVWLRLGALQL